MTTLRTAAAALLALLGMSISASAAAQNSTHAYGASRPIADRYIVVLQAGARNWQAEADNFVRNSGGQMHHAFGAVLQGFAATLPPQAAEALRRHPLVAQVEQDQTVSVQQYSQSPATWGLDRIDQATLALNSLFTYEGTGAGVNAYVIDSGIRSDHAEFGNRVAAGFTAISDGRGTQDCNGHGTHVAGTLGGAVYGVAKAVTLVPVRVLDCSGNGSWSGVIAGLDWVVQHAVPARKVVNMSLGGGTSASLNAAVASAVKSGVTVVVAAGNSNADACTSSPAGEPLALTVGATTSSDARASFSNWGSCVDMFAPGASITSAWHTSATGLNTISGTSMASPHAAGVAAVALQANPAASPAAIMNLLTSIAHPLLTTSLGTGSPKRLLNSHSFVAATEPTTKTIAVKSITSSASKVFKTWYAKATVTVRDLASGAVMQNVTVRGSFSPGVTASCVTASTGSCTLDNAGLPTTTTSSDFSVTALEATAAVYDSSQNAITTLRIRRP